MPKPDDAGNIRRRGTEATRMPAPWLQTAAVPRSLPERWRARLSLVDSREQPLQEAIDGLRIDPANHGHEIVLRIDIDQVRAVAVVGKSGGRRTRPALPVGVKKPVHVPIDRLRPSGAGGLIEPILREA